MLVLTRRVGESLIIGDSKVTVLTVDKNRVRLRVNDSEAVMVYIKKSLTIAPDIKISPRKIDSKQVKLGITAPSDVTINREEISKGVSDRHF